MLSTNEAFRKFKSRFELNKNEREDASKRQQEIRSIIRKTLSIETDFLTGSYARHTKTKPLKDVDIFFVLHESEKAYRERPPAELLEAFKKPLADEYGEEHVRSQRRSLCVKFGVTIVEDETDDKIVSFDVVPSFPMNDHYEVPDTISQSGWTQTNPKTHAEKAVKAHEAYSKEWKGLVRMMKYWNNNHNKPIKPSFLIEVMAMEALHPPFGGDFGREIQAFFATLADRIGEIWKDPAGLGPSVSDQMDQAACEIARQTLLDAQNQAALAIRQSREGKNGESLRTWRALFGPLFPLS
jgi:predicted nucleotidyltransferase